MEPSFTDDPGTRDMLAWQAGEEAAFDRLVTAYSGRLFALFTRFLGPVPEREDMVQETFLRVLRAREGYQPTARFSTWLYRIAFNLSVNRSERTRPTTSLDAHPFAPPAQPSDEPPESHLERDDVVRAVRAAIAALPETQRAALILARYEELSFAEIAVVLGSTEKAVKSLVHRARENLRAELAPFLPQLLP
jgi:RNA polymerase sigma-70 factor (ECF subfamily)